MAESKMAKVLIVDDEPKISAMIAALLRKEGHQAVCATTPGAVLSQLQNDRPDLVLMDLSMPEIDGLDLLDAIAGDSRYFDVPIAVLSSRSDEKSVNAAHRLGAKAFIEKGQAWEITYDRIKANLPMA